MRWLTFRRDRDRGATTVIVVILLSAFLLGLGAIVTDVGSWYAQRAQVQNGADAGALAVAMTCADGDCDLAAADQYAPANSNQTMDTSAAVTTGFPCGYAPDSATPLPPCSAGTEDGTYCPAPPDNPDTPYVTVHVETSTKVMPILGNILDPSDDGKRVLACAQASWGPAMGLGQAVAVTISGCEWLKNTENGTVFATIPEDGDYAADAPRYTDPPTYLDTITARRESDSYVEADGTNFYVTGGPGGKGIYDPRNDAKAPYRPDPPPPSDASVAGSETVLTPHGFGNSCNEGNPGWAAPGQFSWLSNDTCTVAISGETYVGSPGVSAAPCEPAFWKSRFHREPIFLPVYSAVDGNTYTLEGFAAFVVTGWDIRATANNWSVKVMPSAIAEADPGLSLAEHNYCGTYTGSPSDICIYGYFTQALIPASHLPSGGGGGQDLGAVAPYLSG